MDGKPELVIGYGSDSLPITASCSACGAKMLDEDKSTSTADDRIRWYVTMFRLHVLKEHPPSPEAGT